MTLGDDIDPALAELREQATSRMKHPCVVKPVEDVAPDEKGRDLPAYGSASFSGRCRVRNRGAYGSEESASSSTITTTRRELHIPWDAPAQPIGSVVFLDGEQTPSYRITDGADGDDLTACRYPVERVTL